MCKGKPENLIFKNYAVCLKKTIINQLLPK